MGREQLRVKNNLTSQSLIQNHIGRVCERIQAAFKIATPSGQQKAMNASKSASAPSEAGPSVKKPRARVSKQLDQGIVSVEALKANIKYPNRSKKSDLIDVLIEPYSNNKIKITAEEVRLASSKVDQDNDK
ncbi:unnamed protein product [Tilletia caries]|uniref:Uncharacterized protein n=1 Tax=Tilletia caries TaxID=13290 RepID=A0ABN7J9J3_9BASI|nr:unnamed protein product [Tilletia caries]